VLRVRRRDSKSDCAASATVRGDERIVAYYHWHPPSQGDDFSKACHRAVGNLDESEDKKSDQRHRGTKREIGTAPPFP
jgi:hypothetical protein